MNRTARHTLVFVLLAAALVALFALNLCVGSVAVALPDVLAALGGGAVGSVSGDIVWTIRLPRIVAVVLLGGALALSGFLLQTFFNNPIAGPYILGISSGAKLVVALVMVVFAGSSVALSSWALVGAAFVGALGAMSFVLLVARRIDSQAMLIVAGVMIGYICSAVTDFLVTFATDQNIVSLRNWSLGSFSGTTWDDVLVMAPIVAVCAVCCFMLSKPMGAFQLGENYARSMGVDVRAFRVALVVLSSLLAACVTAFAGPISFVGIAVPHLVKRFLGTSKPLVVVPAAFLGGAVFCLGCDLIARCVFAPTEVSISAVTALFGAPVVIMILVRRRTRGAPGTPSSPLFSTLRIKIRGGGKAGESAAPDAPRHDGTSDTSSSRHVERRREAPQSRHPVDGSRDLETGFLDYASYGRSARNDEGDVPALQTHGLAVGYDGHAVVEGIDLAAEAGRIVVLIGPNGAGKSTILKTLSGQVPPVAGTASLLGDGIFSMSAVERARSMAVVLTDRVSTELLTCEDVVEAGRYPYTGRLGVLREADYAAVDAAMTLMDVSALRDVDFMQVSDGQRQRVLIARAIAQQPRVMLLDEPTSFLDIRYQIDLLRALRSLAHEQGVAIVASLHELTLARIVSDSAVCVKDGGVFAQGVPDDVFTADVIDALYDLEPGVFDPETGKIVLGEDAAGGGEGGAA